MGICPRCGSWVDDGDVCRSCGGVREREDDDYYKPTPVNKERPYDEWDHYGCGIDKYPKWDYDVKESKYYNKIEKCLSKEVIKELTKIGRSLESQIYCLIEIIGAIEKKWGCTFEKIYYKKRPNEYSNINIEFINKTGKYLDAKLIANFIPNKDYDSPFDDNIQLTFDEGYITKQPIFKKLKKNMEAEGYRYARMDYYPRRPKDEDVTIWFTKTSPYIYLNKLFNFSLKYNDITRSEEHIEFYDWIYYEDEKDLDSTGRRLKKKMNEIEKEYNRKYNYTSGLTLYFGLKTFHYDLETKDLKKEANTKLKQYPREELFSISANSINRFKKGTKIKLVKETDDKTDYNHIAIYLDNNKIGYVSRMARYGISGAGELNIQDYAYAEYLTLGVNGIHVYPVFRLIKTPQNDNKKPETSTQPNRNEIKKLKEKARQILKKCSEYKKAKQYMEADKCYDELIKINPTVKNWEEKAANLINMEKYDEAQKCLNKAKSLTEFPNSTTIRIIQQTINEKQGNGNQNEILTPQDNEKPGPNTQANKKQNEIKKLKEKTNQILKKCSEYKKAKQYIEVDKCYDELIKINPTVKNWEEKATNLINMEKYDEAQKCLNKAKSLSKFPNSTSIQTIQKLINDKQNEIPTKTPQKTINNNQNEIPVQTQQNHALKEEYEKAIAYIDSLLADDPLNIEYWSKKYDYYAKLNKYEEMEESIDEFLELNSDSYFLWYLKGELNIKLKKYEKSIRYLNKSLKLNPDYPLALHKKAIVSIEQKRFKSAITCFNKLIRLNPKNKELYIRRANIYLKDLKDYNKAIKGYEKAINMPEAMESHDTKMFEEGLNSIPWNNLAYAYLKIGRYDACLSYCRDGIKYNQNNSPYIFTIDEIIDEITDMMDGMERLKNDLKKINDLF